MKKIVSQLEKHESEKCWICGRDQEGYFGSPHVRELSGRYAGKRIVTVYSLCKCCFQIDSACAEAKANDIRFTEIGVGTTEIQSYEGKRCICGAVTHVHLGCCIQCSKDIRMLTKIQAEAKFIDKLLKNLRVEIKSKVKEMKNGN